MKHMQENYDITSISFENFTHFCQWVKTISETNKTVDELENHATVKQVWKKLTMEGEITVNPTLWFTR